MIMILSYSKIIIMIIMTYQTNTRNPFDGPAATNIGTFDITWPNIISNQQSCRGYFWGPVSQLTLSTPTFESPLIGSSVARFGYYTMGTHYVRHLFKITPLRCKKSQHLLNLNFHLSRQPSSGTTGLCPTSLLYHWPTPSAHTCPHSCVHGACVEANSTIVCA